MAGATMAVGLQRRATRFCWLVVAVSLLALRPAHGGENAMVDLSNADNGSSIEVSVGTQINVTLQTIGSGRYGTPSLSSNAVRFIDVSEGAPNPGGPVQIMRFRANSAGGAQIAIPFSGGMGPNAATPPFRLSVQVNAATMP